MNKITEETPEEVLLTPAEVAKRLHVSPVTVRHWALQGKLPCITTPGGHRRFRPEDIERLAAQPSVDASAALRILIVDDDRQVATFLSEFVQTFVKDVKVVIANDGFEAAVQLHEHLPDLVLVDLMMPGMDGVSVCQRIKQHPQLQHTHVIGMTGYPTAENTARFCNAGAETVLPKPLDTQKLRQLIEQLSPNRNS
jgi:excisionase family DNA binding protein